MKIEHEIEINADIEDVWQKTLDFNNWPMWNPNVEVAQSHISGEVKKGDTFTLKQKGMKEVTWKIVKLEPMSLCSWVGQVNGMEFKAIHSLDSSENGTKNHLVLEVKGGLILKILSPFLRPLFKSALVKENEGLKLSFQ